MRPFIFHQRDKSSSGANHRWRAVITNVLQILPAELIGYKKRVHSSFDISSSCCSRQSIAKQKLFLHLFILFVSCKRHQVAFKSGVGRLIQLYASLENALLDFGANLLANIGSHVVNAAANSIITH